MFICKSSRRTKNLSNLKSSLVCRACVWYETLPGVLKYIIHSLFLQSNIPGLSFWPIPQYREFCLLFLKQMPRIRRSSWKKRKILNNVLMLIRQNVLIMSNSVITITVITIRKWSFFWSQMFTLQYKPSRLLWTLFAGPRWNVITKWVRLREKVTIKKT